jgi:hypothetical protein
LSRFSVAGLGLSSQAQFGIVSSLWLMSIKIKIINGEIKFKFNQLFAYSASYSVS